MKNKKGMDTKALDLIFATPVIVLLVIIFYVFLSGSTIEKQESMIRGDLLRVRIDESLSDWAYLLPGDFTKETDHVEKQFKGQLTQAGFDVDDIDCEKEEILRCEFDLEYGEDPEFHTSYQRNIYIPKKYKISTVRFVGDLVYE